MHIHFILGTDTEIGKTYSTVKLIQYLQKNNIETSALKPIACGNIQSDGFEINEDVQQFNLANSHQVPIHKINPFNFKLATSPNICAKKEQIVLTPNLILEQIQLTLNQLPANTKSVSTHIFIEGVGGIMTPINSKQTFLDLVKIANYPAILVIGIKLGSLNHALLSIETLKRYKIKCDGFIANCIDPKMEFVQEYIDTLQEMLAIPLLGIINFNCKLLPFKTLDNLFGITENE